MADMENTQQTPSPKIWTKFSYQDWGLAVIFTLLLIGMGTSQTHMKKNPQIILMGLGGILLLLKVAKENKVSSVLFYILLGVLCYDLIFMLTNHVAYTLNPDAGWTEVDGKRYRVMNYTWVWGVIAGLILSPILLIIYRKSVQRNQLLEGIFVALFLMSSCLIFYINEVR